MIHKSQIKVKNIFRNGRPEDERGRYLKKVSSLPGCVAINQLRLPIVVACGDKTQDTERWGRDLSTVVP